MFIRLDAKTFAEWGNEFAAYACATYNNYMAPELARHLPHGG